MGKSYRRSDLDERIVAISPAANRPLIRPQQTRAGHDLRSCRTNWFSACIQCSAFVTDSGSRRLEMAKKPKEWSQ